MKEDIKNILEISKYALNYKMMIVTDIIFGAIGIIWLIASIFLPELLVGFDMGTYFMILAGATFVQLSYSVVYCGLGATSAEYRNIVLKYSTVIMGVSALICILISIVFHLFSLMRSPMYMNRMAYSMIQAGLFAFYIQAYFAVAYKKYVISSVVFIALIVPMSSTATRYNIYDKIGELSLGIAVVICVALTLAGSLAYYGISRLMYRKPFDPLAFRTAIARAAK